jgi:chromosome segregation ATPase
MNTPSKKLFENAQVTASLVVAAVAFIGMAAGMAGSYMNLNMRINTIEIELKNEKKQRDDLTVRVTSIELLFNQIDKKHDILDERQKVMNQKLEEILTILKRRYDRVESQPLQDVPLDWPSTASN